MDGPADIVLDVVDDESRHRDTVEKLREYERGGVREYWLVDPFERWARVYRLRDGRYEEIPLGGRSVLHSEALPGFWIDVEWLWLPEPDDWVAYEAWGLI